MHDQLWVVATYSFNRHLLGSLYPHLLSEFETLRRAGLKLFSRLFNRAYIFKGKWFTSLITPRRIQDFTERHNIVYRKIKGKKLVSDAKSAQIEQSRLFDDGVLDPDQQYNMDESHFTIDRDDSKTLDFRGADKVKYRSIVSGREGITMCVLLRGSSDAKLLCPMLIFKNKSSNYPIQGLPDAVAGVAYRSSPSAFINNNIIQKWLQEVRCWVLERHLWMNNASGHSGVSVLALGKQLRTHIDFSRLNLMLLILCNLLIDFQSSV
ncbi:hypothetical protein PHMEG_00024925 [Phytophthora megakarya]|uniref:DDE-1 domain-containing protein n=1 Tax=Phytophthora megakarya TaxID=4795 RepID=A0A225VEQ8_9STRA|nr:hypothetical protein PHMEG_00024925 [Phytophthora megakarya]